MTPLAFIDVETTSLERPSSRTPGEVWEVAAIVRHENDLGPYETRHTWLLPVALDYADPDSLRISGFHDRHPQGDRFDAKDHPAGTVAVTHEQFVAEFGLMTDGCHWVGNVPSFDEERIATIFHRQGHTGPFPWHYHLIDIESAVAGYLHRQADVCRRNDLPLTAGANLRPATPPWNSEDLSLAIGVDPTTFDRHTAIGDALWAMAQWDAITTEG